MGFMDDLRATSRNGECKVARWLDTLDKNYRAEVVEAVGSEYPSKTIWRVIVNRDGMVFSESVFARHRKGECGCGLQG
jgi:hypothetical protein